MSNIDELLEFNKRFIENKEFEKYNTTKYPSKKIAILSCMDTRLTELLPAALNIQNGDVKMIKNAGALISSPLGSVMRSLVIAIYELGVEEIMVINHYDCGMQNIDSTAIIEKMIKRGVQEKDIELMNYLGMDVKKWLKGFDNPIISVKETVQNIKQHPLIPKDIRVSGFLMDPNTGRLDFIE